MRCLVHTLLTCILGLPMLGCNSFGNGKLVQELRNENERLLAEFRAERDRREKSEKTLQVVESRLAESEKLLAKQYQSPDASRLSRLQSAPLNTPPRNPIQQNPTQPPFSSELPGTFDQLGEDQDSGLRWQRRVSSNNG